MHQLRIIALVPGSRGLFIGCVMHPRGQIQEHEFLTENLNALSIYQRGAHLVDVTICQPGQTAQSFLRRAGGATNKCWMEERAGLIRG